VVLPTINFHSLIAASGSIPKTKTKISEKKQQMETKCHFGTLFGTGIVEAKPLDEIEQLIPINYLSALQT